jgi:cobalt-zinc-cadmium efflux system membrane fusion protein
MTSIINKKINFIAFLKSGILLLTIALSSCSNQSKNEQTKQEGSQPQAAEISFTKEQCSNAKIEIGAMQKKGLSNILKVNGVLDVPPQNLVSVSAPISGFLKSTTMLEGLYVHKGEIIATIEHTDIAQLQLDFIESKSKFELAELELNRQKELNKAEVNSSKILQQSQHEFNITQAKYKALEEKLRIVGINKLDVLKGNISGVINIHSPINGYVSKVKVNVGKMINQQDVLFEIVDPEHLHAELTVFEKDIVHIKEGMKVRFRLANNPEDELTAAVYLIGRSFDESRSVRIHCHLDKEDKNLLPGMYINAIIELEAKEVNAIPIDAVVRENEKQFIFIQTDEKNCGTHPDCVQHLMNCAIDENCPEHPACEAHEKCINKKNCTHKNCSAHDNCAASSAITTGYQYKIIEVKTGVSDGNYIEIIPSIPINDTTKIVTKGAYFILSQLKMSGKLDACCQ